jgi:DNA processing protein
VALGRLAEPGDPRFAGLVAEMGAVELVDSLIGQRDLGGVLVDIEGRVDAVGPERELERAARAGIRFVIPSDEEWPRQLDDLAATEPLQNRCGVPFGLWVKGPLRLDELAHSVAVVG